MWLGERAKERMFALVFYSSVIDVGRKEEDGWASHLKQHRMYVASGVCESVILNKGKIINELIIKLDIKCP